MTNLNEEVPAHIHNFWIRLCYQLRLALNWVWVVIFFGLAINVGSSWLTSKTFDLTGTPLGWLLIEHFLLTILIVLGLFILTVIINVVAIKYHVSSKHTSQISEQEEQKNCTRFLNRLQTYNDDFLSNHNAVGLQKNAPFITLNLISKPSVVENRARLVSHQEKRPEQVLPNGTSILQIYKKAGGELLILGEPGTGKSTQLYTLARALCTPIEKDDKSLMPVVVNLSTWANKRRSLEEWLIEEINNTYKVPPIQVSQWIHDGQLIPLLDGLDEVPEAARTTCIEAINSFKKEHGLDPLVVCSRSQEYFSLPQRLVLQDAVEIQSLSEKQVDDYFRAVGLSDELLRLRNNTELYSLMTTPLWLDILTKTYATHSSNTSRLNHIISPMKSQKVHKEGTKQEQQVAEQKQQRHVFEEYIQRMHAQRNGKARYSLQRMKYWLGRLARQMEQQNRSIFSLEFMQPDLLPTEREHKWYYVLGVLLPAVLIGILLSFIISNIFGTSDIESTLTDCILSGVVAYLLTAQPTSALLMQDRWKTIWQYFYKRGLFVGLLIAAGTGLSYSLYFRSLRGYSLDDWLHDWFVYGVCFGIYGILLSFLLVRKQAANNPSQQNNLSPWKTLWHRFLTSRYLKNAVMVGVLGGVCSALADCLSSSVQQTTSIPILDGIGDMIILGLTVLLLGLITEGGKETIQPAELVEWSWKSFREKRHLRNAIVVGTLVGFSIGIGYTIDYHLRIGLVIAFIYGVCGGLSYWILLGTFYAFSSSNIIEEEKHTTPNEGIHRSLRNGLLFGLLISCICGVVSIFDYMLIFKIVSGYTDFISTPPIFAVLVGISGGLIGILAGGGLPYLRHRLLCLQLWQAKRIPLDFQRFLDFATTCALLHRAGGAYRFNHKLLQEYFATLNETE